ncbi:trypco2 family protein [Sorangium sp. So ce1151]|uniref:trypco2 family protein n=1 Tax=Sorangium sp. So ce1151 TaxID=3133332 RepID=UPI003F629D9D
MAEPTELRSVIEQLRQDLQALNETVGGEDLRFAVESVDVELHVGVTREAGAEAKAKFWVLELGADGRYGTERTHTIKLTLKPRLKGAKEGTETLIGRDD